MLFWVAERRENYVASSIHPTAFFNRDFPAKNFGVETQLARNFERRFVSRHGKRR